jgi:hypothetical protein
MPFKSQQMNEDTINTHGEGRKNEITSSGGNLSVYSKITDPIHAMQVMGEMIAGSGMFGCTKTEQGMVLAMQCLAEGKPPLELAKTYHIIEGKLTMRADAMLGRYLTSGGKVKWTERSDKRVAATWICDGNEVEIAVTIEEMTKNGVALGNNGKLKTNWQRFPRQMLTARNVSEAVRLLMPQIVSGIYTPEEVADFSNNDRQVIPAQVAPVVQHIQPVKLEVVDENTTAKDSLIARLDELLAQYEPHATNYLMTKSYLKAGQSYRDLDAMTAQRMLASPAKIIGILEGIK